MTRMEIVTKLERIERTKEHLENLLHDNLNYYTEYTIGAFTIVGSQHSYKKKYETNTGIVFDKERFAFFLKNEISALEGESAELIQKLIKGK